MVVSLPPRTSHQLQSLDPTFFRSLNATYNQKCDQFMKFHHFERISVTNIAEFFAKVYNQVTANEKAIKAFQIAGIQSLNIYRFIRGGRVCKYSQ